MSLRERYSADDPREWLNRAKSNLAIAKNRVPDAYLEDLCFEAQQAAEKAIKARLMMLNINFPYVHDLARLLSLLDDVGEYVPDAVRRAADLTPYAVLTRYPSSTRELTFEEYDAAVATAEAVVQWAEERLQSDGLQP